MNITGYSRGFPPEIPTENANTVIDNIIRCFDNTNYANNAIYALLDNISTGNSTGKSREYPKSFLYDDKGFSMKYAQENKVKYF